MNAIPPRLKPARPTREDPWGEKFLTILVAVGILRWLYMSFLR